MPTGKVDIAGATLTAYRRLGDTQLKVIEKRGAKDGERDIPSSDEEDFSAHEMGLIASGKADWARYKASLATHKQGFEGQILQHQNMLDEGLSQKSNQFIQQKQNDLNELANTSGPASPHQVELDTEQTNIERSLVDLKVQLGRELQVKMELIYLPFLIFLALIEVPVNKMAFALFFDASSQMIQLLALAVGTILIFFAHTIGMELKHMTCKEVKTSNIKTWSMGLLGMFSLLVMYFLALMRQEVANLQGQDESLDINALIAGIDPSQLAKDVISTDLDQAGVILLLLNVAVFTAGLVAAFYRHDPHIDYEKLHNTNKKLTKEQAKRRMEYAHDLAEQSAAWDDKIDLVDKERQMRKEKIMELEKDSEQYDAQSEQDFKLVLAVIERKLLAYQAGNQTTRTTTPPAYFGRKGLESLTEELCAQ